MNTQVTATPAPQGEELLKPANPAAPAAATPAPESPKPAVEAVPANHVEESPKEDPKFASRFAALSRREKEARAREQALKEKEAKFSEWEKEQKLFSENPLEYLTKKGISFDKLTQMALNDGKKPAELMVKELEEKIEREKRESQERQTKEAQQRAENNKKAFLKNADEFIKAKKSDFEMLATNESPAELILSVMEEYYEMTSEKDESGNVLKPGKILSLEEAAKITEEGLEKEFEEKWANVTKIKKKFEPKAPAPETPASTQAAEAKPSVTLTNSQATSVATPHRPQVLDVDASKREAAKLLRWT